MTESQLQAVSAYISNGKKSVYVAENVYRKP